jgi:hypothetical protein
MSRLRYNDDKVNAFFMHRRNLAADWGWRVSLRYVVGTGGRPNHPLVPADLL